MSYISRRAAGCLFVCIAAVSSLAQVSPPPVPQRLVVHSNILNEDRVIWVRMPAAAEGKTDRYPVLYITDAGGNINEIGGVIDFLAASNLMPALIVVGIENTDRVRDLTPTHADIKEDDGTISRYPTSGGADKFLDFIQKELMPEVERRYATHPYRIIAGHSLGGLFAVHALFARPELWNAGIATSPSLWWDDFQVLTHTQNVLSGQKEFNKAFFFALGEEAGPMNVGFTRLQKMVATNPPKGFLVKSQRLRENHGSTELLGHYSAFRVMFADWPLPDSPKGETASEGLERIERHQRAISARLGFQISNERSINRTGYRFLGNKKIADALMIFKRNVELHPESANVYDSYAEGLEAAGQPEAARVNVAKAVEIGTRTGDPELPAFKKHLEKLDAAGKVAPKAQ